MEAVVLAGGKADDPLALRFGVQAKTLVPYRGRPQVEYVLEALSQAGLSSILVGPAVNLHPAPRLQLPDRGSILENLEQALHHIEGSRLLVATGDMPFLTAEAVRYVLNHAPPAALVYTVVTKQTIEQRFPNMRRTYARLREGHFTGGNLIVLNKTLFAQALPLAKKAIALRKKPLALAGLIGWSTLLRVLLGWASISELEQRVGHILGVSAKALVVPFAEVGVDLDKEEDLRWLEEA